jgi:CO/xanthine dehydrogenase Mo-binding subunit
MTIVEETTPGDARLDGSVGRSLPRPDQRAKLDGSAQFVADLPAGDALQLKLLRSDVAHARLRSVDTEAALAVPGVVAVVTAADLAAAGMDADTWGHYVRDRPVFAREVIRFAGEVIAAVVAETELSALEGVHAIEVAYDELPPVLDAEAAVAPEAPQVHQKPPVPGYSCPDPEQLRDGNAVYVYPIAFERPAELPLPSELVTVEHEYAFPAVYQYAMEPHAVLAYWQPDRIQIDSACQHPFQVREEIATLFGVDADTVQVRVPFIGGGFGSKSYTKMEPIAVAVSRVVGRRVRLVNSTEDAMLTTRRHAMSLRMSTTATRDGRLVDRQARVLMDTGAYADNGPTVTMVAALGAVGAYRWSTVEIDARCVYTHLPPAGSYRGFGSTHVMWASESQIDEIAELTGLDRVEIRRRNLLRRGEEYVPGHTPVDADLVGDLDLLAREMDWSAAPAPGTGRGLAIGISPGGASPRSEARVALDPDGSVVVWVGSQEIGQGARTVHAQIAAETLGVSPESVRVPATDTTTTPYDRSTGASRSTTVAGSAVQRASRRLRELILDAAAPRVGAREMLRIEGRVVIGPDGVVPLAGIGPLEAQDDAGDIASGHGPEIFWEVSAVGALTAVDIDTGEVTVDRVVTVADVGRAINPSLVHRQDEGAALQALGNALFEEMHFDERGVLLNGSLMDYRVPSTHDLPQEVRCVLVENADGPGPMGAKGCGEGVFAGMVAAVVCGLGEPGVRVRELPLTPDRVWQAIARREGDR